MTDFVLNTDIAFIQKKWILLKKKFTRVRIGECTAPWPLYDRFDELFGRFIQKRRLYLHDFLIL